MKYDLGKKSNLLWIDEGTRLIRHIDNASCVTVRVKAYVPLEEYPSFKNRRGPLSNV